MHEPAGNGRDADSRDLGALALLSVEELDLLEALARLLVAVAESVRGAISAREETVHVGAHNGVQRAALHLLDRLLGLEEVQVVGYVFVQDVLRELVHLPQNLVIVFWQSGLPVSVVGARVRGRHVHGLVWLLRGVEHASSGSGCVGVALVLSCSRLLGHSLLFFDTVHDLVELATLEEARRHVLDEGRPAPVLEVLQATLSLEVDAP